MVRPELSIRISGSAEQATITLGGEIDLNTAPDLEERASLVLEARPACLVLDFGEVTFLGSVGLGVLVRISQRARRAGCAFRTVNVVTEVRHVMEVAGMVDALNVQPR